MTAPARAPRTRLRWHWDRLAHLAWVTALAVALALWAAEIGLGPA